MRREENIKEDLISRADAFNALQIRGDYNTLNEVYEKLEKLPSVKPGIMDNDAENSLMLCRENYKAQMESLGYDASGNPLD